jgi:hypothetical protein
MKAGRYRLTAPVFASQDDATAGEPVLFTITRDFDLPSPAAPIDVPFSAP